MLPAVVIIAFYGPNRPCYQTGEEAHALKPTRLAQATNAPQARRIRRKHTRVWYPHFSCSIMTNEIVDQDHYPTVHSVWNSQKKVSLNIASEAS